MRITCEDDAEIRSATLAIAAGHLDTIGATQFWDTVSARVDEDRASLLLDLTAVDWVSSAGVGALVRLLTRCQSFGGAMALFGAAPRVQHVLGICGLEAVLNVRASAAGARARLRELGAV